MHMSGSSVGPDPPQITGTPSASFSARGDLDRRLDRERRQAEPDQVGANLAEGVDQQPYSVSEKGL